MTEAQWLAADDPEPLLTAVQAAGKASERKLRLWACDCVRSAWEHLGNDVSKSAVEVAERYADGAASADELQAVQGPAAEHADYLRRFLDWYSVHWRGGTFNGEGLGDAETEEHVAWAAAAVAEPVVEALRVARAVQEGKRYAAESLVTAPLEPPRQALLLRDIFTLRGPAVDPAWLTWNDGTVRRLAQMAYQERLLPSGHLDATRLAVLADALEEAGCQDAEVMAHLRGAGPHVRGCWVVDLLTARG